MPPLASSRRVGCSHAQRERRRMRSSHVHGRVHAAFRMGGRLGGCASGDRLLDRWCDLCVDAPHPGTYTQAQRLRSRRRLHGLRRPLPRRVGGRADQARSTATALAVRAARPSPDPASRHRVAARARWRLGALACPSARAGVGDSAAGASVGDSAAAGRQVAAPLVVCTHRRSRPDLPAAPAGYCSA